MKICVIINRKSGLFRTYRFDEFAERLSASFQRHGITADLHFAEGDEIRSAAGQAVAAARAGGLDAVVVGGGDGTVRTVAGEIANSGVPLGVLPLGTLNHFARDTKIPIDVDEAVTVIGAGNLRTVDAAEVNGEVFINNSSVGLYPHLVVDRERRNLSAHVPRRVATLIAVGRLLRRWPLRRLSLVAQARIEHFHTPFLFVGNNRYDPAAFGRRDTLDAGELWVSIAKHRTRLSFLWSVVCSLFGAATQADLESFTVLNATVNSRASRLLVSLDGEIAPLRPPLVYRSLPGALRLLVPASPALAVL